MFKNICYAVVTFIIVLCGFVYMRDHTKPTRAAAAPARVLSPIQEYELRQKCADLVISKADFLGATGNALRSDVKSHYNATTNRCYAEVTVMKNFGLNYPSVPANYLTESVDDAQTDELLVFADREGEKSFGNIWMRSGDSSATFDEAVKEINRLMESE